MFCDQCGNKIEDGEAFCAVCGAPTGAEAGENPASAGQSGGSSVSAAVPRTEEPGRKKAAASNRKAPKGKKGRKGIIAAAVAAAVVVVAAGTGCALYFTGDGYQCEKNMKLASACYEEKDYKEALEYYEEVLKLDSTVTEAYLQSAKIYMKQEAFEDAVKILEKGIKKAGRKDEDAAEALKEKLTEVYLAEARYYVKLAEERYEEKNYKEALEYYEEALKLDSTVTEAYLQSAEIYIKEEDFEDAVKILEEGIEKAAKGKKDAGAALEEKLAEVYLAAADYYLDREDYAAALEVLAQGISETGKESLENRRQEAELAMITAEKASSSVSAPTPAAPTAPPAPAVTPQPMPTPTPKPAPLRVTVALPGGDKLDKGNRWYAKMTSEINEYTNMDVTWQFENSATYNDQLQQKIQTGKAADIIVVSGTIDDPNSSYILKACDEGLFWDLSPYLDRFDNLATIPDATLAACSYNGKVYAIPRSNGRLARYGFGYRTDWLERLGMDSPATWAEFKEMLRVFTECDPDGNGLNDTQGLVVDGWQGCWNIVFAWFGVPDTWGLDKDGNLIYYAMTDEYNEALREIRDLYSKGYINDGSVNGIPDFMDIGAGRTRQYMTDGKAGCMIQVLDDIRKAETGGVGFVAQGFSTDDYPVIELAGYLDCGHGIHVLACGGGYRGTIMISKTGSIKTEAQLLQALGFLNDLNDGVMLNLIEYGWEGLTYSIDWDGYVYDFTEEELKASGVGSRQAYNDGFDQILAHYTAEANARPVERPGVTAAIYVQENKLYKDNIPYVVVNYGAGLSSKVAADRGAELSKIINDAQLAYIRGEIDKNGLEQALSGWKTAGGEDMTREMNDLYRASRR